MSSRREQLYRRVKFKDVVIMIVCQRCVLRQLKCRLSFLFQKCVECVRTNKKCELVASMINFNVIDRALAKLEKKKLKVKTTQLIVIEQLRAFHVKLQRLRK